MTTFFKGIMKGEILKNSKQATVRAGIAGHGVTVLVLALAAVTASAQVSLTTVVDQALRNSTAVRIADAELQKTTAQLTEVKDAYVPTVVLGSAVGYSYGFPVGQPSIYSLTSQSLLVSLPLRQYTRAAKMALEASRKSLDDTREKVILDAALAYVELDAVNQELAGCDEQMKFVGRLQEIEQARVDAGVDARSDLLQARLNAAELKLRRLHLAARADGLQQQLASLTGLPAEGIQPVGSSIPAIPELQGDGLRGRAPGIEAARFQTLAQRFQARGDKMGNWFPQIAYAAQYNRDAKFNNYEQYYNHFQQNNFSVGIDIQFSLFDASKRAKARESAAQALRATVEEEQARNDSNEQVHRINSSLRELSAQAEVATLKQQIASEQLTATMTQLEAGNGSPGAPQLSPKAEQLARIDERQKFVDALDSALDLSKARLNLLRVLGHMEDWIRSKPIQ